MSGSIAWSVQQFKADLQAIIDPRLIMKLCQAAGHAWRERTLGPVQTIYLFIAQILHGNTSCAHVRQLGNFAFTRSAYCEARKRLPLEVLRNLLRATGQRVTEQVSRVGLWHGHRVVSVDGSTFSMPDARQVRGLFRWAPENRGCEFPVCKFVALFDVITGALLDLAPATMRDHELKTVPFVLHVRLPGATAEHAVAVCHSRAGLLATRGFSASSSSCCPQALERTAVGVDSTTRLPRSDRGVDQAR